MPAMVSPVLLGIGGQAFAQPLFQRLQPLGQGAGQGFLGRHGLGELAADLALLASNVSSRGSGWRVPRPPLWARAKATISAAATTATARIITAKSINP